MMSTETLTTITNTVLLPCIEFGLPVAVLFALTGKIINFILSFITGNEKVKL